MVCWTSYSDPFLTLLIDYSLVLGLLVSSAFNTNIFSHLGFWAFFGISM